MKLVSWNVNGLRACLTHGFEDFLKAADADVVCLQEIKMTADQLDREFEGYHLFMNPAQKKGYSGTALLSKTKPLSVTFGSDIEGRVIKAEYEDFFVVNVYTPNAQDELKRIDFRLQWDQEFRDMVSELDKIKPVLICGDMNVARNEMELKNPKTNVGNAGFSIEERESFQKLLDKGFVDTFRFFYPDLRDAYSWWSYRFKAREKNAGWRIDYWLCSDRFKENLEDSIINKDVLGSDHCPVTLLIK